MATQMMSNSHGHAKSGSSSSIPYALPASPTLTNPDMILPDYDDSAVSLDRSHSPLTMWQNNHFDLSAQSFSLGAPVTPVTPVTPIIYGNGTMLSDIGEVTEAESTTGSIHSPFASSGGYMRPDSPARSPAHHSPLSLPYDAVKKKKSDSKMAARDRERRLSMESMGSTSTITNGDRQGLFADFDDSVSVDDSNFQGDDEDSVAASYVYDESESGSKTPPSQPRAKSLDPDAEERYSAALSRRAEQILANAKKRLTTMEGNLNRARSSLSIDSSSDPSPPISRATFRESQYGLIRNSIGHSRISSESNIAAAAASFKPAKLSPRSSSALGVTGSYHRLLQSSRSADCIRDPPRSASPPKVITPYRSGSLTKSKASLHDSKYNLEPLSEDGFVPLVEVVEAKDLSHGLPSPSSIAPSFIAERDVRRSSSATQVRDLKDQMNELKGRLSSLREQARADSLKRRSVQSLRSPSSLSQHAHGFLPDSVSEEVRGRSMNDISRWNDGVESLHDSEEGIKHGDDDNISVIASSVYSDDDAISPRAERQSVLYAPRINLPEDDQMEEEMEDEYDDDDLDDMRTEDGYQDDELTDMEDDVSVGGESLYHDSVQNQLSHEDREDAFDYEHFFLHSAMGSMSQRKAGGKRRSWESFTSEDSVETTRGPMSKTEVQHRRRASNASISTTDSFATATEGRTTRIDYEDAEEDDYPEMPDGPGTPSPRTEKRMTFGFYNSIRNNDSNSDHSQSHIPNFSNARRPQSSAATFAHRPSVSSMGSAGTNRSFPLVNRPKPNGILTPESSPDQGLRHISESLMSETASICESIHSGTKPIEMLQREDQILVERLVASLGKCVLGLAENGRASTESRQYRRKIELARRLLDGIEQHE